MLRSNLYLFHSKNNKDMHAGVKWCCCKELGMPKRLQLRCGSTITKQQQLLLDVRLGGIHASICKLKQ